MHEDLIAYATRNPWKHIDPAIHRPGQASILQIRQQGCHEDECAFLLAEQDTVSCCRGVPVCPGCLSVLDPPRFPHGMEYFQCQECHRAGYVIKAENWEIYDWIVLLLMTVGELQSWLRRDLIQPEVKNG